MEVAVVHDLERPKPVAWGMVGGLAVVGAGLLFVPNLYVVSAGAAFLAGALLASPVMLAEALHPRWRIEVLDDRLVLPTSSWWFRAPVEVRPADMREVVWMSGLYVTADGVKLLLPARWFGDREPEALIQRLQAWRWGPPADIGARDPRSDQA